MPIARLERGTADCHFSSADRVRVGAVVRLDLEIEAHLGSTLNPGDVLVLEKGNRLEGPRLDAIRSAAARGR